MNANTPNITKDPTEAASAVNHLTAHVIGSLIAQQLIDPISDDVPYFWETVEAAVDRAIDGLEPIELSKVIAARYAARLERQQAQRASHSSASDTDAL